MKVIDLNNISLKKFFARDGATNTVLNKLEFENAIRNNKYKKIGVDQMGNDLFETTVPVRGRNSISNYGADIIDLSHSLIVTCPVKFFQNWNTLQIQTRNISSIAN